MFRSCFIGLAIVALLGVACDRTKNAANETTQPGASAATAEKRLSAEETEFLQTFAKANETEIELAKMAQDKAENRKVKHYADQLEDDHSNALDDAKRIARGANLTLDTTPPAEKASMDTKLSALSGRAFDRTYIAMMVDGHKEKIAEVERARANATGDVRDLIDRALPVMREHLQKAQDLWNEISR